MPGCYPYGVRASGSERSRHMRGGFVLWSIEKVAMLGLRLAAAGRLAQAHLWCGQMRAAGLVTAVRTLGQGVVARARALATSGPSSQSAPRTAMSTWGPAEEVDEGVERHGADWQGIKEPYQLELMPSMDAIRPWGHHAIRMKDAFWPWMAASCWTIQMPIWGESSRGEACPTMGFRCRP